MSSAVSAETERLPRINTDLGFFCFLNHVVPKSDQNSLHRTEFAWPFKIKKIAVSGSFTPNILRHSKD